MINIIKYLNAIVIIFLYIIVTMLVGIFIFPITIIVELVAFISDYLNDTNNYDHGIFIEYLNNIKDHIKTMWYKLTY